MTLLEKQRDLLDALGQVGGHSDRLAWLVARVRRQTPLDAAHKTESSRLEGCLSDLWLVAEFRDGRCFFRCDSNSQIVKAVTGLLCEFYSGHAPGEIIAVDPSFLKQVGITQHLTANRRNALTRVWDRIRSFAESHLAEQGRTKAN